MGRRRRLAAMAATALTTTMLASGPRTVSYRVYPSDFSRAPVAVELGKGGSRHRGWYLRLADADGVRYWWHTHNDGSTGGGVATNVDPGVYESALSGATGTAVALAAGHVTAATRATALAAALELDAAIDSATVAGADNGDGSRTITVVGTWTSFAVGARTWAQRGDCSICGQHSMRRTLAAEVAGAADTAITRNLAQRFTSGAIPATAYIHAVSIVLGATVSTTAANIPRLGLRSGSASTTIPGNTVLFDFGQLPVSEVVAGRRATIYLTSAQAVSLRAALTGATGQIWMLVKASATTQNTSLPSGAGLWNGEMADGNLRVDNTTAGSVASGATVFPANWTDTGITNAAVLAVALHYDIDPASNGEGYIPDTLMDISTAPDIVALPNTVTTQVAATITGHRGGHLHTVRALLQDNGPRYCVIGSTDTTDITADTDDPDLTGATLLHDFGQVASGAPGVVTMTAPTGDSSVILPAVFALQFKGNGLEGNGWLTLAGDVPPTTADDCILAIGAATDGTNQHELDYAGETGDPTTAFTLPKAGAYTQPNNRPGCEVTVRYMPDSIVAA